SSRLDPVTEQHLQRALERLLLGRTAIVIAHRLETVESVDEIMIMDGGRIIEAGRRTDLSADPDSRYARLRRAAMSLDLNLGTTRATTSRAAAAELLEDLAWPSRPTRSA